MPNPDTSTTSTPDLSAVKAAVIETLGLEGRGHTIEPTTSLSSLPEFDSLAALELIVELERRFGITIEDDDVSGETFATVATIAALVCSKSG